MSEMTGSELDAKTFKAIRKGLEFLRSQKVYIESDGTVSRGMNCPPQGMEEFYANLFDAIGYEVILDRNADGICEVNDNADTR